MIFGSIIFLSRDGQQLLLCCSKDITFWFVLCFYLFNASVSKKYGIGLPMEADNFPFPGR
uniref:Uncharacterized protein n=1 Tax=Rhizophora mucronata TaxID=61149 RepID=A0A2P2QFI4_RHIMU